jgi:hypothetical protein
MLRSALADGFITGVGLTLARLALGDFRTQLIVANGV